ncbi:MAG: hypothetical protein IKX82_01860 [Bacilli bacterium]|nr:hypothetical protein [Bacilli bacterium]
MANNQQGKGFLNSKFFSSRIKSANVKLFPEAALGYLLGPIMALISNISSILYGARETGGLEGAFNALIDWILQNKKMANAVLRSSTYRFNWKIENLVRQFLKPLKPLKRNKIADENAFKQGAFIQAEVAILRIWIADGCHFDREAILSQCLSVAEDSCFADLL